MYTITVTLNTEAKLSDLLALLDALDANTSVDGYDINLGQDDDPIKVTPGLYASPQPPLDLPPLPDPDVSPLQLDTSRTNGLRQMAKYADTLGVVCPTCHSGAGEPCVTATTGLSAIYPHMPRQRAARAVKATKKGSKR